MDDPVNDVTGVVQRLTQGSPKVQEDTINKYFTPDASFIHPICRTGSYDGSRVVLLAIYQWYKLLSPRIEIAVNSIAFDQENLTLYLNISQIFAPWFLPIIQRCKVTLTVILKLAQEAESKKYYISSQEDLYQTDQLSRLVTLGGVGAPFVILFQFFAAFCSVLGAVLGYPFTLLLQRHANRTNQIWENSEEGNKTLGRVTKLS